MFSFQFLYNILPRCDRPSLSLAGSNPTQASQLQPTASGRIWSIVIHQRPGFHPRSRKAFGHDQSPSMIPKGCLKAAREIRDKVVASVTKFCERSRCLPVPMLLTSMAPRASTSRGQGVSPGAPHALSPGLLSSKTSSTKSWRTTSTNNSALVSGSRTGLASLRASSCGRLPPTI